MLGKILFIFFSLSIRSPFIGDVMDYELKTGYEAENHQVGILFERENGMYGYGIDAYSRVPISIKINDTKLHNNFEWYTRSVKDMDFQIVRFLYPLELDEASYKLGLSLSTAYWSDPKVLFTFSVKMQDWVKFSAETDFTSRDIVSLYVGKKIDINDKVFVEPFYKYRAINDEIDFQGKVRVGYKL